MKTNKSDLKYVVERADYLSDYSKESFYNYIDYLDGERLSAEKYKKLLEDSTKIKEQYKSLYENEKSLNSTLKALIKKNIKMLGDIQKSGDYIKIESLLYLLSKLEL